jgi:hypothetical protein
MTISLRKGEAADANIVGDICYRAFKAIAERRYFTPDLPSADVATSMSRTIRKLVSSSGTA